MESKFARVAVVGAGAAGLAMCAALVKEGVCVCVFEQNQSLGGTWIHESSSSHDGSTSTSTSTSTFPSTSTFRLAAVHSSLYDSLHTNLPHRAMAFSTLEFPKDTEPFPHHPRVLEYLQDYAQHHGLVKYVQFGTRITKIEPLPRPSRLIHGSQWRIMHLSVGSHEIAKTCVEDFDAVVICNGHYSVPQYPKIPGMETCMKRIHHSHWYRIPAPYMHQRVLVLGSGSSAIDIARELKTVAQVVALSARTLSPTTLSSLDHLEIPTRKWPKSIQDELYVEFEDGTTERYDFIICCTGYKYDFPFLQTTCISEERISSQISSIDDRVILDTDSRIVAPLYQHIFHIHNPTLAFVGLVWTVIPFAVCEVQANVIARVFSRKSKLLSAEEMLHELQRSFSEFDEPLRYFHRLGLKQFEYCRDLARVFHVQALEDWREDLYRNAKAERFKALGY